MMIAMLVMGRVANESDVTVAAFARLALDETFLVAVLMNGHNGPMVMTDMESWKNETHGQEYEKPGDKAVPLHDPEQRAQHSTLILLVSEAVWAT